MAKSLTVREGIVRRTFQRATLYLVEKFFPVQWNRYGFQGMINGFRPMRSPTRQLQALTESHAFAVGVLRLAFTVGSTPWAIEDKDGKVVEEGAHVELFKDVNVLTNWFEFSAKMVMHLLATGNAYILKDPMSVKGTPMELWLLRPDQVKPVVLTPGQVSYEHRPLDGPMKTYKADEVEHVKLPNPFSDFLGMGMLSFMETEIDIDAAAAEFNRLWFQNGASLGTILETDNKMDPDRARDILEAFKQTHQGFLKAHKTAILDNGLKAKPASAGPKESDYIETRRVAGNNIGGLMGVPPIQRGQVDNANRSNSVTQDIIFLRDAVQPLLKVMQEPLTFIVKTFDKTKVFRFHPAVVDGDEAKATIFSLGFNMGSVSPNDYRVHVLGLPAVPNNPAMDLHYMALNYLPIDGLDSGQPQPAKRVQLRGVFDDSFERFKSALVIHQPKTIEVKAEDEFPQGTSTQRRILKFVVNNRASTERRMRTGIRKGLKAQGEAYVKAWNKKSTSGQVLTLKDAGDVARGTDVPPLDEALNPVMQEELKHQYSLLAGLFSLDTTFEEGQSRFGTAQGRLAQRLVAVDEATKTQVESIIRDGMERGLTQYEIANGTADGSYPGIRGLFDDMAAERATLIARTEGAALQDQSAMAAYDDMGVDIVDVLGCQDFVKMPGQVYGCNSQDIPLAVILASPIEFHPNHTGAIVPRAPLKAAHFVALQRALGQA